MKSNDVIRHIFFSSLFHVFVLAQRRSDSKRAEVVFMSLFLRIILCAVAAAVVYFLKSSMKTATLLRLTSIDSKCNIFVCSGISIHFSLLLVLALSIFLLCFFFGTFLYFLLLLIFFFLPLFFFRFDIFLSFSFTSSINYSHVFVL